MSQIQLFEYSIYLNNILALNLILLTPILSLGILLFLYPPKHFEITGMVLGVLINMPYLFLFNIMAEYLGWWHFAPDENHFYNIPVEAVIGWTVFWGAFLSYAFKKYSIVTPVVVAIIIDMSLMPLLNGLFVLDKSWLYGEIFFVLTCLLPSLFIFRLTVSRRHILIRSLLQSYGWGGWIVFLIPAITLQLEGHNIFDIFEWPLFRSTSFVLCLGLSMLIGFCALFEFALKGKGTPIPVDPPQKLVTSGIYGYVANPLQISTLLMFLCFAFFYQSIGMLYPTLMVVIFSEGFVRWHHSRDIKNRFGNEWLDYRGTVRNWFPNLHPYNT